MGCGRKKSLLGHLCLVPLFLAIAVLAQTQTLSLAAPVGEEAGYQLGRNSTDDLGRRRVKREAGLTSFKTLPSSSAGGGGSGGEGGTPVGDQIDRLARAIVLRPSEMANASDSPITRYYRLYNRCSSKHLRIAGRHVDTLAMPGDIYSELRVQTRRSFDSQLTIQGSRSMNFLCFNKKGRLTIKHSDRERRCVFHEILSPDHFTQFQSVFNPHWMIGFGRKGQRLHGDWRSRPPKQHRCFQFVKTDFPYLDHDLNRLSGIAADQLGRHGPAGAPLPNRNLEQQSNFQSTHSVSKLQHSSKT